MQIYVNFRKKHQIQVEDGLNIVAIIFKYLIPKSLLLWFISLWQFSKLKVLLLIPIVF